MDVVILYNITCHSVLQDPLYAMIQTQESTSEYGPDDLNKVIYSDIDPNAVAKLAEIVTQESTCKPLC